MCWVDKQKRGILGRNQHGACKCTLAQHDGGCSRVSTGQIRRAFHNIQISMSPFVSEPKTNDQKKLPGISRILSHRPKPSNYIQLCWPLWGVYSTSLATSLWDASWATSGALPGSWVAMNLGNCGRGGGGHRVDRLETCSTIWGRKGYSANAEGRRRLQDEKGWGTGQILTASRPWLGTFWSPTSSLSWVDWDPPQS